MIKSYAAALLLAIATAAAAPALAQKVAPGLWEHQMTMKGARMDAAMAQMQQQMAAMPPEQRKMMEDMMARQGVGMAAGKPNSVRVCITPEQAARDEMPQHDGRCKQQSMQRSGNVVRFKFVCTGEPPASGEGEFTLVSDKENKGRVTVNTTVKGQPERMEIEQAGKWISADCGAIKPRP